MEDPDEEEMSVDDEEDVDMEMEIQQMMQGIKFSTIMAGQHEGKTRISYRGNGGIAVLGVDERSACENWWKNKKNDWSKKKDWRKLLKCV